MKIPMTSPEGPSKRKRKGNLGITTQKTKPVQLGAWPEVLERKIIINASETSKCLHNFPLRPKDCRVSGQNVYNILRLCLVHLKFSDLNLSDLIWTYFFRTDLITRSYLLNFSQYIRKNIVMWGLVWFVSMSTLLIFNYYNFY